MQLILAVAAAVGAIWLAVGPVQEAFWDAGYRRDRLRSVRWVRANARLTGGRRYRDGRKTPSCGLRRWWNRVRVKVGGVER